jgi:hypothetical protein
MLGSGYYLSRLGLTHDDVTLFAGSSFDLSTRHSHEGTAISSPNCVGIPVLSPIDIYPVAPEKFSRYEKRRKM